MVDLATYSRCSTRSGTRNRTHEHIYIYRIYYLLGMSNPSNEFKGRGLFNGHIA